MDSKIVKAVVYQDRALIVRQILATISTQENEVVFENIPPTVDRDSLRIKALGKGVVRINGLGLIENQLGQASNEELRKLKKEIITLSDEIEKLEGKKRWVQNQENFINAAQNRIPSEMLLDFTFKKIGVVEFEKAVSEYLKEQLSLCETKQQLEKKQKNLQNQKQTLEQRFKDMQQGYHSVVLNAKADFEVVQAGEVRFLLSYHVPNCSWNPYYDARMLFEKKELEITFYGEVRQITGENWDNVELNLSTANPALPAEIPELESWYVGLNQNQDFFSVADKTAIETSGINLTFRIPKTESLLSHQTGKKIPVDLQSFPAKISYVCVPKISQHVFLQVSAENIGQYPFLPGNMSIFYDSDYVGSSYMPATVVNQEIKASLGIEESINVSREKLKEYKESKGITGSQTKITYEYQIEVQNFKEEEIQIAILENLPISKNSEIKIKLEKIEPEPLEIDEKGIIKWDLNLKSKEKKIIEWVYSLEYPKDKILTGIE